MFKILLFIFTFLFLGCLFSIYNFPILIIILEIIIIIHVESMPFTGPSTVYFRADWYSFNWIAFYTIYALNNRLAAYKTLEMYSFLEHCRCSSTDSALAIALVMCMSGLVLQVNVGLFVCLSCSYCVAQTILELVFVLLLELESQEFCYVSLGQENEKPFTVKPWMAHRFHTEQTRKSIQLAIRASFTDKEDYGRIEKTLVYWKSRFLSWRSWLHPDIRKVTCIKC